MKKDELRAISCGQAAAFFREQPDVTGEEPVFHFGSCRITLLHMPERRLGSLCLPQTQVTFEGDPGDTEAIYRRFFLRFLSGGA